MNAAARLDDPAAQIAAEEAARALKAPLQGLQGRERKHELKRQREARPAALAAASSFVAHSDAGEFGCAWGHVAWAAAGSRAGGGGGYFKG